MNIDLTKLNHKFLHKPLVVGGKAKEYYEVRKSGADVDFIVHEDDHKNLAKKYPESIKDLWGDLGVCVQEFELWKTIAQFNYEEMSEGAVELESYKVISLEKLVFLTALGIKEEKYRKDLELIVKRIIDEKYEGIDTSKYENQDSMLKDL